jgi:aminomethyltransferase
MSALKRTSLFECHQVLGAKLVEFAGWEMPVQYDGVIQEHQAVRNAAGIFDVSHMGEVRVKGSASQAVLDYLTCNDVSKVQSGQAQYSALLNERGGVIDDLIIYRVSSEEFLLCVNASNTIQVLGWIEGQVAELVRSGIIQTGTITIEDESDSTSLLALQGPNAEHILKQDAELAPAADLGYFRCQQLSWRGAPVFIARTGYTGEDGFELFVPSKAVVELWKHFVESHKVAPIGLAARDTLRLEVGYPLHGHELSPEVSALQSGIGWIVKLNKESDFVGKRALVAEKAQGIKRALVGFKLTVPGIARFGDVVVSQGGDILGEVTSGTRSPTLELSVGIARVPYELKAVGTELNLQVRKRILKAQVVDLPFYKRGAS